MIEELLEITSFNDLEEKGYMIVGEHNIKGFKNLIEMCECCINTRPNILLFIANYDSICYFCDVIKRKEG